MSTYDGAARAHYYRNKEAVLARARAERAADPEGHRAKERTRYARDKEKIRARQRIYQASEKGKRAKYRDRDGRRARIKGVFIEAVDRAVVYEMHGGMCGICENFIEGAFHVDHVRPLALGGTHCYANVQPAHPACNLKKRRK